MKSIQADEQGPLEPGIEVEILPDGSSVTSRVKIKARRQEDGKGIRYTVRRDNVMAMVESTEGFRPGRIVVKNLILHKDTEISPPVELGIEVTEEDVQRAQGQSFRLAYTQGRRWMVWPEEFPCKAGFVTVALAKREDPAIAISP